MGKKDFCLIAKTLTAYWKEVGIVIPKTTSVYIIINRIIPIISLLLSSACNRILLELILPSKKYINEQANIRPNERNNILTISTSFA
jgi:hypothetical protein